MKGIKMRNLGKLSKSIVSTGLALGLGCWAVAQPVTVTQRVGPQPAGLNPRIGFLNVYSATTEFRESDNTYRYPHTDYRIYTNDGRFLGWVSNSISRTDELSEKVPLLSGAYQIVAESETEGTVRVPVVIRTGHTTVVHLERDKDWTPPIFARESDLVHLPNGQPVGFRAHAR